MGKLRQHTQKHAKMTRLGRVLVVALLVVVVVPALVLAAPPPSSSAKAAAEGRRRRACPAEPLAPGDYDFTISSDGLQR